MLDIAQDAAGKLQGGGNIGGIAVHQHDIGGVDGDIGAGTDGDADIGPDQCGGVIDAVPHMATTSPFCCRERMTASFCWGSTSGMTLGMPTSLAMASAVRR